MKLLLWLQFSDEKAVTQETDNNSVQRLLDYISTSFSINSLCSIVDSAKFQLNSMFKHIDYAITSDALPISEIDNCCRSLAGERAFLYKAFKYIYSEVNGNKAQMKRFVDLFYLYLLINVNSAVK